MFIGLNEWITHYYNFTPNGNKLLQVQIMSSDVATNHRWHSKKNNIAADGAFCSIASKLKSLWKQTIHERDRNSRKMKNDDQTMHITKRYRTNFGWCERYSCDDSNHNDFQISLNGGAIGVEKKSFFTWLSAPRQIWLENWLLGSYKCGFVDKRSTTLRCIVNVVEHVSCLNAFG